MDDNKILPEWLAYHYEVLPLQRIILATDPYSVTSPKPILDAYQHHLGLNVSIWNDENYIYAGNNSYEIVITRQQNATNADRNKAYVWRQRVFYTTCAKQLKKEGYTWVALIDTDEYIAFNFYAEHANYSLNEKGVPCENIEVPGVRCRADGVPVNMMMRLASKFPPDMGGTNSTIAHFIASSNWDEATKYRRISHVCDILPRVNMGGGTGNNATHAAAPPGFDGLEFRTLRYQHTLERAAQLPGKAIINVQEWQPTKWTLHMHVGNHRCFNAKRRTRPDASLSFFRIHHYAGTYEEFMSRPGDQHRRSTTSYRERSQQNVSDKVDQVAGWLLSFTRRVGHNRAYYLTQGLRKWAFETDSIVSGMASLTALKNNTNP